MLTDYLGENMKYDPMMDDSSDDGLPDLEELPALDKASNADFEVSLYFKFCEFIFVSDSECTAQNRKSNTSC